MITLTLSTIALTDCALRDMNFYLIFKGTEHSCFMSTGLSFSFLNSKDIAELQIINEMVGICGTQWQSHLCGKSFRLIIKFTEIDRNKFESEILAIGHPTENKFLVVNSGRGLMSYQDAMSLINEQGID